MTSDPADGLVVVDALATEPLALYPHRHAVRGDLLARLDRHAEARQEFERAGLTRNDGERRLFRARAAALNADVTADIDGGATPG